MRQHVALMPTPNPRRRRNTKAAHYLADIIVISGWVPALYQMSGTLPTWRSSLSRTTELDALVQPLLPRSGRRPVSDALRQAGFDPIDAGPAFAIWQRQAEERAAIEFLVPLQGPYRDIGRVAAVGGQEPLGAIQLPNVALLQKFVVQLPLLIEGTATTPERVHVNVPLLGTFVVTRGAIFRQRASGSGKQKAGKDLLYIHDVLVAGAEVVAQVHRRMCRGVMRN